MVNTIDIPIHSIILFVGPTNSGCTTAAYYLNDKLNMIGKSDLISIDQIRRSYTFATDGRTPGYLNEADDLSYKTLLFNIEKSISFPNNSAFVTVEADAQDERFRQDVLDLAKKHRYNVVCCLFDFKHISDYPIGSSSQEQRAREISSFRRKVLPTIRSRDYALIVRVRSPEELLRPVSTTFDVFKKCSYVNSTHRPIAVIGDIHECVDELRELIGKLYELHPTAKLILAGDVIDKGFNTAGIIQYLTEELPQIFSDYVLVIGNHEYYVRHKLTDGTAPYFSSAESSYTSIQSFLADDNLKQKFFDLLDERGQQFAYVVSCYERSIYVTHSPCPNAALGKLDAVSRRDQRHFKLGTGDEREDRVRKGISFIYDEARPYHPYHIFGHIDHDSDRLDYRNKIFIDSGCVYGNKLSCVIINNSQISYVKINAKREKNARLIKNLTSTKKDFDIRDYNLSFHDQRRLKAFVDHDIRFIAGTIAPAPSTTTQLEGIDAAIKYYRSNGIADITAQPKYMGSRATMYIDVSDLSKSFITSRNGFVISKTPEIQQAIETAFNVISDHFDGILPTGTIILDGELTPWSALGTNLIETTYKRYQAAVEYELDKLTNDPVFSGFDNNKATLEQRAHGLNVFKQQLELFGNADDCIRYEIFDVLQIPGVDLSNTTPSDRYEIEGANSIKSVSVNLHDPDEVAMLHKYWSTITETCSLEGVVIKPNLPTKDLPHNVAPAMKVRNEDYLHLIYGYDYKLRYQQHCDKKRIDYKVKLSISEFWIGRQMLESDKSQRYELYVKMIAQLNKEKTTDPRL